MSFKGFTKSLARAPQQFKVKFNLGEHTKDAVYLDAERRFQELERETKKLHDESSKYAIAINGMMSHQIEFAQAVEEIYKPISGRASDPNSFQFEGNAEGIQACEDYQAIVRELQEALGPELEMIESRVISPADQLLEVIKVIRKVATKRDHKQLDYDRHRATLKKLEEKKDKSLKDEKALYKAEADVESATQEFNYYNDLLKDELPKLFTLEAEFIRPLFQSFYYMQLNVFYTLHEKMNGMNISYFNLDLDIEEAFDMKRGDVQEQAEALKIVHFRTQAAKRSNSSRLNPLGKGEDGKFGGRSRASSNVDENPPPPYTSDGATPDLAEAAKGKGPPPIPRGKPAHLKPVEVATALYDYEAQAHGDLGFSAGDLIAITHRTNNTNEWWSGKINGREGQFPANYVQLN
ncbi:hypothetical protein N7495_009277 [Penicillium taxi]|uniref:uncharacterized protein n=1 Tax=Penicillium taxi TaxID=168475 RepID=UPI0025450942|nr:uncharacterized protein N7495_009277 [Penicillium taxi]KAJ5884767.1 hypothetical protein N7495_009277 [Penicillium taxi]